MKLDIFRIQRSQVSRCGTGYCIFMYGHGYPVLDVNHLIVSMDMDMDTSTSTSCLYVISTPKLDALSNGELFLAFKQFLMLIFRFFLGNASFLTLKLKRDTFPGAIWKLFLCIIRQSVKRWFRNCIFWIEVNIGFRGNCLHNFTYLTFRVFRHFRQTADPELRGHVYGRSGHDRRLLGIRHSLHAEISRGPETSSGRNWVCGPAWTCSDP